MRNRWTWFGLLLALMILNYTDRQAISGVFPLLKTQFHLTDAALGLFGTAFMFSYAITAPLFGMWSDKWKPHKVAAIGVAVWSLFTLLSATAWSYGSLFAFRAMVGIGEAAFMATGSTILSRLFPEQRRSFILGLFNLGLPVGGALGVVAAGNIGARFGWQPAFLVVGIPGLILAGFLWAGRDVRGVDGGTVDVESTAPSPESTLELAPSFGRDILSLLRRPSYVMTIIGYIGVSYAFGAIVYFAPTYFHRDVGYSLTAASNLTGIIEVVAGLLGAPIGGLLADAWHRHNPRGRAYTLTVGLVISGVLLYIGALDKSLILLLLATFFMMWHAGVASALIFDTSPTPLWNTASALGIFLMHLCLGDAWSPWITGIVSDHTGLPHALALLALPMLIAAIAFWAAGRLTPLRR